MKSPYEKQIRKKADEIIEILKAGNFIAEIKYWEEYCVTVEILENNSVTGNMKIYYSPNKKSFKNVFKINDDKKCNEIKTILSGDVKDIYKNAGYEIDVDGSYQNGRTGYGAIIRKDGKIVKKLNGIVKETDVDGSRQVAGELKAAMEAVKWCDDNSIKEAVIYYDYDGVRKWARREWKAKKPVTKAYTEFMQDINVKIHWVKIKSHTGIYWNEQADKLAGKAVISEQ